MSGPHCVVSNPLAVFLLFATLPGILQAKIQRCMREFDPSNCNALEEVWAFDAEGKKCIEVVYGGCGKPKHLSNRFETQEECMQSCGSLLDGSSGSNASEMNNVGESASSFKPPVFGMGRRVSDALNGIGGDGYFTDNEMAIENMRSVLVHMGQQVAKRPESNLQYPGNGVSTAFGGAPIYEQGQGRFVDAPLAGIPPLYGAGLGPYVAPQLIPGSGQRPLPYGQEYMQPQGLQEPLIGYGAPFTGNFVQPPAYPLTETFYGQGPILSNPLAPTYGGAPAPPLLPPVQVYPEVMNMPGGVPYWRVKRSAKE